MLDQTNQLINSCIATCQGACLRVETSAGIIRLMSATNIPTAFAQSGIAVPTPAPTVPVIPQQAVTNDSVEQTKKRRGSVIRIFRMVCYEKTAKK